MGTVLPGDVQHRVDKEAAEHDSEARRIRQRVLGIALALALLTFAVYGRSLRFGLLDWDDSINIVQNPDYNPVTLQSIGHLWYSAYNDQYMPVMWTVWGLLARVSAVSPSIPRAGCPPSPFVALPFHLLALGMHLVNVVLVFLLLRRLLKGQTLCAAAGALLFGIHPIQTEPAVWCNGANITLAYAFGLGALLLYQRSQEAGDVSGGAKSPAKIHGGLYALATLLLALGLLTKPTLIAVALVAWILDCTARRPARRYALPLLGWVLLSLAVITINWAVSKNSQAIHVPVYYRPLVAGDALAFYLRQIFLPLRFGIDYGRTPYAVIHAGWAYVTWLVPAALGLLLWRLRQPTLRLALGLFAAALLPMLGLVPFYFQCISTVADRYAYLAMLGPALSFAFMLSRMPMRRTAVITATGVLAFCALMSLGQTESWRDSLTLYRHAIQVNPHTAIMANNLAGMLTREGQPEAAERLYRQALANDPEYSHAHLNLGDLLMKSGRLDEAAPHFEAALRLMPDLPQANFGLGLYYAQHHDPQRAVVLWRKTLQARPADLTTHYDLAQALLAVGNAEEARGHLRAALAIDSGYTPARVALAGIQEPARRP